MSNNSSAIDHDGGLDYILLLRLIVWGYIGMTLSVFGIVGNIITVLLCHVQISFFFLYLLPSYSLRYLIGYELYKTNQPPFAFEILLTRIPTTPIYNTISLSIIYLTIAVSIDRLILVIFPLKAKRILTQRATLITILSIYTFCIVYCIPYWFEQRYVPESKTCELTTIGRKIHKHIRIYFYIPIVNLIPFITLTMINVTIIQNLIDNKRRKQHLCGKGNKKKQADYHITLMLVAVIIVFVLCQLPALILNVWYAIDPLKSFSIFLFQSLNIVSILLMVFNTSTNFLLYCFFGQKFRQTLIEFILNILPKQHNQNNTQMRISKMIQSQPLQFSENNQEKNTRISTADVPKRISFKNNKTTTITTTTTKPNELNQQPIVNDEKLNPKVPNEKSNQTLVQSTSNHQEESHPLIEKTEQVLVINENFPSKSEQQQFKLYTGSNGKRVLLLKI